MHKPKFTSFVGFQQNVFNVTKALLRRWVAEVHMHLIYLIYWFFTPKSRMEGGNLAVPQGNIWPSEGCCQTFPKYSRRGNQHEPVSNWERPQWGVPQQRSQLTRIYAVVEQHVSVPCDCTTFYTVSIWTSIYFSLYLPNAGRHGNSGTRATFTSVGTGAGASSQGDILALCTLASLRANHRTRYNAQWRLVSCANKKKNENNMILVHSAKNLPQAVLARENAQNIFFQQNTQFHEYLPLKETNCLC